MNEIAIKVENLSKIYKLYDNPIDRLKESLSLTKKEYHKDHYALNNISFEVRKGETVGIIGVNGSGKSTLLKIITGVLTQSYGNVMVDGKISALLELGAGFNPEYTGIENIYLNGTMMGYTKEEMNNKVDSILEFSDIGEFISQPVKTYSSGMFARLAFAVSINVEPDILIVDEALSVGDIFFQNKCYKKFDELQKTGTTILFVSHDIGSIKQMCSKVLWLDAGTQKMFGEKNNVCSQYLNEQFKDMNKMNEKTSVNKGNELLIFKESLDFLKIPKIIIDNKSILSDVVRIISFFIKDTNDSIVSQIKTKNTYFFHIIAEIFEDIDNAIFGFTLENNKGIGILAVNSFVANNDKTIHCKQGTTMEVIFTIEIPKLAKGQYLISPAVANGTQKNHKMLTWLHNTLIITIDNEGYNLSIIELDIETQITCYNKKNVELY